ncbi:tetratricopeptide repeat protein [Sphingomicrobium astaxanthinifaciens]|uniref:tetratricopeptide repeat protein n=1 Tax=Sphingomicrobium astaxanthinifaciens TaxID=1227949 RepID=UPI001FCB443F|nr:tetratricopeptide repeat protein [Sphingomicrobium astaxanthinifaciens]MCJ7421332.1 hypothetical protein [Sphingomicrobium astaxanthinifaciens]
MTLLLAAFLGAALGAQPVPTVGLPGEMLVCGTDASRESRECRAQLAMKDGRHADAAAEFIAIADDAAGLVEAARARAAAAALFNAAGQHEDALLAASAAAASNSLAPLQRGWVLLDKAWALHALGRAEEANAALAQAGPLAQDDPFYWLAAAEMAGQSGDYPTALERIEQAEARAPDAPEVLFTKGEVLLASGDEAGARAAWTAAVAAMPDHPAARIAAERLAALAAAAPPEAPAR